MSISDNMLLEGYSHDWILKRPFTDEEWKEILKWTKKTIDKAEDHEISIKGPNGDGNPVLSAKTIAFNGDKSKQLSETEPASKKEHYESFILHKDEGLNSFQSCKTGFDRNSIRPYDKVVLTVLWGVKQIAPDAFEKLESDGGPSAFKNYFGTDRPQNPPKAGSGRNVAPPSPESYQEKNLSDFSHWFDSKLNDLLSKKQDLYLFKVTPGLDRLPMGQLARAMLADGGHYFTASKWAAKTVHRAVGTEKYAAGHKLVNQTPFLVGVGDTVSKAAKNIVFMVKENRSMDEEARPLNYDNFIQWLHAVEPRFRRELLGVYIFTKVGKNILASVRPEYRMPYAERMVYHFTKDTKTRNNIMKNLPVLVGVGKSPEEAKKDIRFVIQDLEEGVFCAHCGMKINEGTCLCHFDRAREMDLSETIQLALDEAQKVNFRQALALMVAKRAISASDASKMTLAMDNTVAMMQEIQALREKINVSENLYQELRKEVIPFLKKIGAYEKAKDVEEGLEELYSENSKLNKSWIQMNEAFKIVVNNMTNPAAMKSFYDNEIIVTLSHMTKQQKAIYSDIVYKFLDGVKEFKAELVSESTKFENNIGIDEGMIGKIMSFVTGMLTKLGALGKQLISKSDSLENQSSELLKKVKKTVSESILDIFSGQIVSESILNETNSALVQANQKRIKTENDLPKLVDAGFATQEEVDLGKDILKRCEACIKELKEHEDQVAKAKETMEQKGLDPVHLVQLMVETGVVAELAQEVGVNLDNAGRPGDLDEIILEITDRVSIAFKPQYKRQGSGRELYLEMIQKATKEAQTLAEKRVNDKIEESVIDALSLRELSKDDIKMLQHESNNRRVFGEGFFGDLWNKIAAKIKAVAAKIIGKFKAQKIMRDKLLLDMNKVRTMGKQLQ